MNRNYNQQVKTKELPRKQKKVQKNLNYNFVKKEKSIRAINHADQKNMIGIATQAKKQS